MNCLQFLSWLAKEMIPGVIITWCSVFSAFGQGVHSAGMSQNLIDSGSMPRVFMQDGVSIPTHEQAPSFTPDGNTVYFAVNEAIFFSKKINGKWNRPVVASFSSQWGNW